MNRWRTHRPRRRAAFAGILASLVLGATALGAGAARADEPVVWATAADGVPIPQQCLTAHQIVCSDKSRAIATLYEAGTPVLTFQVRYGDSRGPKYVTGEGHGVISLQSRDHVSSLYGTSMPYANFISWDTNPIKGQAFHYSAEFAQEGYAGASHGCMNIADEAAAAQLFERVTVGTEVYVYWSGANAEVVEPAAPVVEPPAATAQPTPEEERPAPPVTPDPFERVPVPAIGGKVDPLSKLAAALRVV